MAGSQTKRDIALILAASFFYMASPMLITPIITGFSESLGASGVMMGFIGGIMNICSLVSRPFIGVLVDRISKYKLSSFGIFCVLLSCIGYFFAQSPALIVAARIINGLGFACCSTCLSTWMSDLLPPNKIGSGMGIFGTMNALSMAIAPAARHQHLPANQPPHCLFYSCRYCFTGADNCAVCKKQGRSTCAACQTKPAIF